MKGNTSTYLSINEIVNKALLDLGESNHRKEQFVHWAIDYYRRFRMDMAREVKTVKLSMTAWKSIELPVDCVDWIMIGIPNGQQIMTFTKKSLAARTDVNDQSEPSEPNYDSMENPGDGIQFFNYTEHGEDPGKLFGNLVKDNGLGYFDPNPNQHVNEIQLSTHVNAGTEIYLMYLSTLFDPQLHSVVHPYAEDMIRKGIHYENLKHGRRAGNRSVSGDMIYEAKRELDDEICLVAERRWDLSPETIVEAAKSGYRLTPKN
jgi:hypothetical protein